MRNWILPCDDRCDAIFDLHQLFDWHCCAVDWKQCMRELRCWVLPAKLGVIELLKLRQWYLLPLDWPIGNDRMPLGQLLHRRRCDYWIMHFGPIFFCFCQWLLQLPHWKLRPDYRVECMCKLRFRLFRGENGFF